MKIEISDTGDHRKEVRVEVEWERVRDDYEDILSEYMKLPVPGFRPGRASKSMVEKRFERPILDDAGARAVRRLVRQALEDEGITVTGPVSVTELKIEKDKPLFFTAEFTELPAFELCEYGAMDLSTGSDASLRDEISSRLLEETEIDIPENMVREELLFDGEESSVPGDELWDAAEKRVRLLLILNEIARRDGIVIDDRDLDERIEQIALAKGTDDSSLRKFLLRTGGLSRISAFILAEKTLDYLIDINKESE